MPREEQRFLSPGGKKVPQGLLKRDALVLAARDGVADFRRRFPFLGHLVGKEDLLEADGSSGAVVGGEAVEQAAMPELVAVAITGLLGQHLRPAVGNFVDPRNHRVVTVARDWHQLGEGLGRLG
jgi:hypothetical protein